MNSLPGQTQEAKPQRMWRGKYPPSTRQRFAHMAIGEKLYHDGETSDKCANEFQRVGWFGAQRKDVPHA
jgi:hypothetical protein